MELKALHCNENKSEMPNLKSIKGQNCMSWYTSNTILAVGQNGESDSDPSQKCVHSGGWSRGIFRAASMHGMMGPLAIVNYFFLDIYSYIVFIFSHLWMGITTF